MIIFKVLYTIGMVFGIFPFKYKATTNRVEKSAILTIYTNILLICSVLMAPMFFLSLTSKKTEGFNFLSDFILVQNVLFYINTINVYYTVVFKQANYIKLVNRMLQLLEVLTIRNSYNLKIEKFKTTLLKFVILDTILIMPMFYIFKISYNISLLYFIRTIIVFMIAILIRFLSSIIFLGYNCFELMFSELKEMILKSVNLIEDIQKFYCDLTSYEYELKCDKITDEIEKYTEIYIKIVACSSNFSSIFSKFSTLLLSYSFFNFLIVILASYSTVINFVKYFEFMSAKTIYGTVFMFSFLIFLEFGQMYYLITASTKIEKEHEKMKICLKINVEKISKKLTLSVRLSCLHCLVI